MIEHLLCVRFYGGNKDVEIPASALKEVIEKSRLDCCDNVTVVRGAGDEDGDDAVLFRPDSGSAPAGTLVSSVSLSHVGKQGRRGAR